VSLSSPPWWQFWRMVPGKRRGGNRSDRHAGLQSRVENSVSQLRFRKPARWERCGEGRDGIIGPNRHAFSEGGRDYHLDSLIDPEEFRELCFGTHRNALPVMTAAGYVLEGEPAAALNVAALRESCDETKLGRRKARRISE
jgi:hypothetical protein